ncbi:hypothetical protein [Brachybacterium vulturis]|uniref:hypothetical protein n=1 Tax=Brachybacterium vulturis TaxID=2017484 RepID=UPI0015A82BD0|nr:hypothetical protein [Brachybacterium vulturis]
MDATMREATVGEILLETLQTSQPTHTETAYDEVLREVSARVGDQGSIGKADIGALVVWKRSTATAPWSKKLMNTPDAKVREITARAFNLVNDSSKSIPNAGDEARQLLRGIPGLGGGGAIASAVLLAMSPTRMAVWDRRVNKSLKALGRTPKGRRHHYRNYLEIVVDLVEEMQDAIVEGQTVVPRQVDLALYHAAGKPEVLDQLRASVRSAEQARD